MNKQFATQKNPKEKEKKEKIRKIYFAQSFVHVFPSISTILLFFRCANPASASTMVKTNSSIIYSPNSSKDKELINNSSISKRKFTKKQKQKLLLRFENEMSVRNQQFKQSVDNQISLLRIQFNNRLNKILRKFWDVKLQDILQLERELDPNDKLSLFKIIKQLDHQSN